MSYTEIPVGNYVVCDSCNADYTDSPQSGGFLFDSRAIGPCCEATWRQRAAQYGELSHIRGVCTPGMSFGDWVRNVVRAGRPATIQIYGGGDVRER